MFKRIVVPTDGSDITTKAAQTAILMAKASGGQVFAIAVREPFPFGALTQMRPVSPRQFYDAQAQMAAEHLRIVADLAAAAGVPCESHDVESLHPWEAILELAREKQCDVITMASHGRKGVSALLLGSETQRVLMHSPIPVLVVK